MRDISQRPSILHVAGKIEVVRQLVVAGAYLCARDRHRATPLHFACIKGSFAVVEYLLSIKAPMDLVDENAETSLHWAIKKGDSNLRVVQLLVDAGAECSIRDGDGFTVLQRADRSNSTRILAVLDGTYVEGDADIFYELEGYIPRRRTTADRRQSSSSKSANSRQSFSGNSAAPAEAHPRRPSMAAERSQTSHWQDQEFDIAEENCTV